MNQSSSDITSQKHLFNDFFSWSKDLGIQFDSLDVKFHSADNRSLITSKNIKQNENIMFLPKNILISEEVALRLPIN